MATAVNFMAVNHTRLRTLQYGYGIPQYPYCMATILLCPVTPTNHHWYFSDPFWIPEIISTTFATSKIPRTKFLCLNSVIINSWPWTLFIVKSHLLFSSDPACKPLCSGHPENPCHSRDLASYLISMLLSLWTILQFWIHFWTPRPLLTPLESLESLECTWNTQTRVWGRCSTWAEANVRTPLGSGWVVQCTIQHLDNMGDMDCLVSWGTIEVYGFVLQWVCFAYYWSVEWLLADII